jgi:hypothetical protein
MGFAALNPSCIPLKQRDEFLNGNTCLPNDPSQRTRLQVSPGVHRN